MKDEIVDKFYSVYLHDLDVLSMKLDFEPNNLTIVFGEYKSKDKSIYPLTYIFRDVIKFNTDIPTDKNFANEGILKAECKKNGKGYEGKLVFEMENTVWWINLTFLNLEIERTLKEEKL